MNLSDPVNLHDAAWFAQTLAQQLPQARERALATGRALVEVLEEALGAPAAAFTGALGHLMRYPVLDMAQLRLLTPDFEALPFAEAARWQVLLAHDADRASIGVHADPFDRELKQRIEARCERAPRWMLAHHQDLRAMLGEHERNLPALDELDEDEAPRDRRAGKLEELSMQSISEDNGAVVRLVRSTLYDALRAAVSDIHFESDPNGLQIKYRIDGVMKAVRTVPGVETAEQCISRIKILAELDIAERRIPQDGKFRVGYQNREIDLRVSVMPSVHGEDAVLRILDRQSVTEHTDSLSLDHLGFDEATKETFRGLCEAPYGMVLVTGPTGSGKTTTLYAALAELNHGHEKIITIEDPVEYQVPGVLQIPVNEKKGLTFARGLRSILRHDPDKIMVGEIRDAETAQIAVQSALTGHLVLSTVHANNVFDVIGRFINMQVDNYSLMAAVNGIMAQRLVRLVCPLCVEARAPSAALLRKSHLSAAQVSDFRFRAGKGCGACLGTGYKGRRAIAEILVVNDAIRELVTTHQPVRRVREAAHAAGTRDIREAALDLVRAGETTLEEINRVTAVA